MGRKWIACDAGRLAVAETEKRMWNLGADFSMIEATPSRMAAEGELTVEATVEQAGISDKKMLKVRLLDYVPPKTVYEMLDEKNTKAVKRLIKKDSLCLVNFWCVDKTPDADGILRPTQMLVRDKKGLTMEYEALGNSFGDENGEILVQVWDLFGGRASAKVKLNVIE